MVFNPEPALLRAISFFNNKRADEAPPDKMPMYYDIQSDRMFVNVFLGSHVQSRKPFKFNEQAMYDWMPRFAGKPIVLFKYGEHFEHPVIAGASRDINDKFQDTKKVGEVIYPFPKPDKKGTWRGVGEILVNKVKEFLRSLNTDEVPMFHSPQVAYTDPDYDIKDADPMHVAFTDDPAFPPEIARIKSVCEGDESVCLTKLASATAERRAAEATGCQCLASQMRDLVLNNARTVNDNSSLKISNFSSKIIDMPNEDTTKKTDGSGQQTENPDTKSAAELTDQIIESKAKDAVNRMLADINKRKENPETADPKRTMEKALSGEQDKDDTEKDNKPDNKDNEVNDPRLTAALDKIKTMELKDRKQEIAKVIPLTMVTDVKAGGINDKLLNEFVDYWVNTGLTPQQIGEHYNKEMAQLEVVQKANLPKTGKASNSNAFTDDELASHLNKTEQPQFDAPDVDNSDKNDKIASGSAGNSFNYLEFAGMLVSNVSKTEGKGAPRRMID